MKLYGSLTSPFVRKVRIVIAEKQLPVEFIAETPTDPAGHVLALNPLGQVPVLMRDNGEGLFDSAVIVEYLDGQRGAPLIPTAGEARWSVLRWHALGQGMLDATVARMLEGRRSPEQQLFSAITKHETKIAQCLAFAETQMANSFLVDQRFTLADISLGVALGYIDLRYPHDWRARHPRLAQWAGPILTRPSFRDTAAPTS